MRRFSQRNSLVTLSDINITPLLDLAFVLLIIFVITTPHDAEAFERLLGDGSRFGVSITFAAQPSPDGLAQAMSPTGQGAGGPAITC